MEETLSAAHIKSSEKKSEKFKNRRTSLLKIDSICNTLPLRTQEDFENQDSDWFYLNVI